ncbi:MAG: hypothetical protein DMG57_02470 [Acidobacteria bacterium]|nr:MAG: hypothetical protein DMG57_02470 [Acidobacteriota bacterium]
MRRISIFLWATALAAQHDVRHSPATPEDIAAGAKTFRSHCAPCHGLHGEGGRGPNLASGRFYHGGTDASLFTNISQQHLRGDSRDRNARPLSCGRPDPANHRLHPFADYDRAARWRCAARRRVVPIEGLHPLSPGPRPRWKAWA